MQNDDWDDEVLDEDEFDVNEDVENYSECEDEAKENWEGPEAEDDIDRKRATSEHKNSCSSSSSLRFDVA